MTVTSLKKPVGGPGQQFVLEQLHDGDPGVAAALTQAERAPAYGAPVLIRGETGTGKELLARHLHRVSGRTGAFVAVNCAALPDSLIEAELFGYEPGAFTGAHRGGSLGLVREADGGTLFLDEIGDMPYPLQLRLLRLLDSWRVRPVGGQQEYEVDVHLVAATNRDLEQAVAAGDFRLDLLHRIKVVVANLPPLRERTDFDDVTRRLLEEIEPAAILDDDALRELRALRWDGNIRELRNVLLRLVIAADGGTITRTLVKQEAGLSGIGGVKGEFGPVDDEELGAVYRRCRGNVAATARELDISRTTVYKRLRRLEAAAAASGAGPAPDDEE